MSAIRPARPNELESVRTFYYDLIDACAADPGFPPWKQGIHPSVEMLSAAISAQTLFIRECSGQITAAMILNDDVPEGYSDGVWLSELAECEYLVLHLLAVSPAHRRCGLAREMVRGALDIAKAAGKSALRLDAWSGNHPAHALYRSLGFSDTGMMRELLPDGTELSFYLFEYPLSGGTL